jgi:hypothetical protein
VWIFDEALVGYLEMPLNLVEELEVKLNTLTNVSIASWKCSG